MHHICLRACCIFLALGSLCQGQELISAGIDKPLAKFTQAPADGTDFNSLDTLKNLTGTYKGKWKRTIAAEKSSLDDFMNDAGTLHFKLLDTNPQNSSVHQIQGEISLNEVSDLLGENSIIYKLEGVYVEESQHIHAIATTQASEMTILVEQKDYAIRDLSYRQALSQMAKRYLDLTERSRAGALWPGSAYLAPISKKCDLVIDLRPSISSPRQSNTGPKQKSLTHVLMNGTADNEDCGLHLEIGAKMTHLDAFIAKSSKYTLMMSIVTIGKIWLVTKQISVSSTQAQMSNTSMLMIGQQAVLDAFLCLLHFTIGFMVDPVFSAFASTAFFEFVLFALFEMRYLLSIWRARRLQDADVRIQQRELLSLYMRFYTALALSIFLSYALQRYVKLVVFGALSFWVPQIVLCTYSDLKPPLKSFYLWAMSALRLVLPVYMFGCPHNIPGLQYDPIYCCLITFWMAIQVSVLIVQSHFGPRCFVPKRFLPPKYDYFRPLSQKQIADSPRARDIETGDAGHECVICMNPLDLSTASARMVTPCNHYFHPACLQRWMLVKMECPTCRSTLPPE